jgi:hypothetical protein
MQFNQTNITFQFALFVKVHAQTWILIKVEKADPDECFEVCQKLAEISLIHQNSANFIRKHESQSEVTKLKSM